MNKVKQFFNPFLYFESILSSFGIQFESFEEPAYEIIFTEFISKEVYWKLFELIVKDRYKIHDQTLKNIITLNAEVSCL